MLDRLNFLVSTHYIKHVVQTAYDLINIRFFLVKHILYCKLLRFKLYVNCQRVLSLAVKTLERHSTGPEFESPWERISGCG